MNRDLAQLVNREYDLLIVGGGIYGACIARDAALRGLSVALVDQGDFGNATSANSLKIIHGGLRYLQDANLNLMRTMIRERSTWMRIAPHLVHPLPCLMPTNNQLTRNKLVAAVASKVNDWVSFDRNRLLTSDKYLPDGQVISRAEFLQLVPGLELDDVTGGLIWYDAQIYDSERLLLSVILSANQAGASIANYVKATGFLHADRRVRGVKAEDVLSGLQLEVRAKLVVNCTGAWIDQLLESLRLLSKCPKFFPSTATNLVTRQVLPHIAVAIPSQRRTKGQNGGNMHRSRLLFITPWRQYSLIGTVHTTYAGEPQNHRVTEEMIETFINEINIAYPAAALSRSDVYHVHAGFLPAEPTGGADKVQLVRRSRIHDHQLEDGVAGLISAVGVKYTTARDVAQKVVDLAFNKMGRPVPLCQTQRLPVSGGQIDQFDNFLQRAIAKRPASLSPGMIQHLVHFYGSEYSQILNYLAEQPTWGKPVSASSTVLQAEIVHAVREEMAQKLVDIIQRRTGLGAAGLPGETTLRNCARIMTAELGWTQTRERQEIDEVRAAYAPTTVPATAKFG